MGKGSEIRPFYEKTPMLNFRIHMFNVTNKEDVIQGSKSVGFFQFNSFKLNRYIFFFIFYFAKKNQNFKRLARISLSK